MNKSCDLTKVHQANLALLKEIDRICRKYKIRYALDSGTLLGAVRHGGFIPWDDDVDVIFTRPQYEMFLKAASRELPSGMTLLRPEDLCGGRVFYDFTARIIYENSRVHEDNEQMRFYEGKLNHLWVDLFVLDRLPDRAGGAFRARLLQKIVYGLSMAHRDRLDYSKYGLADKLKVGILATAGRLFPMRLLYKLQHLISVKDRKRRTAKWYCSNYAPDWLFVEEDGDWCEEVTEMPFEDTVLMVPAGYHEILTMLYGDYMKLPPEDKRCPAHSSITIEVFDR